MQQPRDRPEKVPDRPYNKDVWHRVLKPRFHGWLTANRAARGAEVSYARIAEHLTAVTGRQHRETQVANWCQIEDERGYPLADSARGLFDFAKDLTLPPGILLPELEKPPSLEVADIEYVLSSITANEWLMKGIERDPLKAFKLACGVCRKAIADAKQPMRLSDSDISGIAFILSNNKDKKEKS